MLSHQGLIGVLDGGIYIKGGGIIRTISDIAGIILSQSDQYDQYNDGHVYRAEWLSSIRYSMVIAHFRHTAHTFETQHAVGAAVGFRLLNLCLNNLKGAGFCKMSCQIQSYTYEL